ncbi:hypothetical protein JCM16303_006125 [Sporobolomyces ruberrimus]
MYLYLLVLWALIQYLKSSIERLLSSRSTRLSISRTSVHLSTTSFNFLPSKALSWIPRRHRKGEQEDQRRLRSYWDVGTLIVLVGFFVSQGILLWAFSKALFALYDLVQYSLDSSVTSTVESVSLIKRAPIPIRPPSTSLPPSSQLLIQPLIPGLTTSFASLPTLILSLAISQIYHEWGHALCAASESIEILSTGLHLFFLLLPTFYVSLPISTFTNSISPTSPYSTLLSGPGSGLTDLRIASAGVWHNVLLVIIGGVGMGKEVGGIGWAEGFVRGWGMKGIEEGVRVVEVTNPILRSLLPLTTLITHLNDLELDSSDLHGSLRLFDNYLERSTRERTSEEGDEMEEEVESYENLGWCLSKELFEPITTRFYSNDSFTTPLAARETPRSIEAGTDCCRTSSSEDALEHHLCFKTSTTTSTPDRLGTCLDPMRLISPESSSNSTQAKVQRCLNQASCVPEKKEGQEEVEETVCARLGQDIVRIRIKDSSDTGRDRGDRSRWNGRNGGEVVIWRGSRKDLRRSLRVTDVEPKYWFVPQTLDETLSRFFG